MPVDAYAWDSANGPPSRRTAVSGKAWAATPMSARGTLNEGAAAAGRAVPKAPSAPVASPVAPAASRVLRDRLLGGSGMAVSFRPGGGAGEAARLPRLTCYEAYALTSSSPTE